MLLAISLIRVVLFPGDEIAKLPLGGEPQESCPDGVSGQETRNSSLSKVRLRAGRRDAAIKSGPRIKAKS